MQVGLENTKDNSVMYVQTLTPAGLRHKHQGCKSIKQDFCEISKSVSIKSSEQAAAGCGGLFHLQLEPLLRIHSV